MILKMVEIEKQNPPQQQHTKLKAGSFGLFDFNDMQNHFNDVRKNLFSFFGDDDYDWAYQQEMKRRQLLEEERQKKLNEEMLRQKSKMHKIIGKNYHQNFLKIKDYI